MTVCTASVFAWFYGNDDVGQAIVAAADRMLTDDGLGIEYEASRAKMAVVSSRLVLVAGDMAFQSEVIGSLRRHFGDSQATTLEVAEAYAAALKEVGLRRAESRYLAPLGMSVASFLAQQSSLSAHVSNYLTEQMQSQFADAEAIIAGSENREAFLYRVDSRGVITNHVDIGFVSIGNGGIHSSAHFMREPYRHYHAYAHALLTTFLAKKGAEVAPGVGSETDMFLINDQGWSWIDRNVIAELQRLEPELRSAVSEKIAELERRLCELPNDPPAGAREAEALPDSDADS